MSLDTLFDVSPNCLLALPTVFATFLTSTLGTLRGTGTPRTVLRRWVLLSTIPPAIPTAVAPMAIAGPLTLDAAPLTVPTTPLLPDPFRLGLLLGLRAAGLRAGVLRALLERLAREDDERLLAADLDRELPAARFVPLPDEELLALGLAFEAPLLLRVPLEVDLVVAILSSPFENVRVATRPTQRLSGAIGCSAPPR
jgi:hypothetical protein